MNQPGPELGGHVVLFGSVAGDGDVLGGELRVVEGLKREVDVRD